ncbi:MAG: hypothetical protein J4N84_04310 [Chloroflexi bacterium]|nr:hypothetical protein [Chloroflexota bacterium]
MNIFRLPHKHVKPETLAEYLDGRLAGTAMARVDQRLTSCATCRDELDSLRTTVSLLKQLPQVVPTRSFTMAAPPPQPALSLPSPLFRMPQWVYAGAASVAAVVLAVLISADTTGALATKRLPVAQPAPRAAQLERFRTVPERSVTQAIIQESVATEEEKPAAPSPAVLSGEQLVQAETAATDREALPEALGVERDALPPVAAAAAAPPPGDATGAALSAQAPSPPEAGPLLPATPEAEAGRTVQTTSRTTSVTETPPSLPPQASQDATGWVWRVSEVLAAAALVAFLAGMIIRRRRMRRGFWY